MTTTLKHLDVLKMHFVIIVPPSTGRGETLVYFLVASTSTDINGVNFCLVSVLTAYCDNAQTDETPISVEFSYLILWHLN